MKRLNPLYLLFIFLVMIVPTQADQIVAGTGISEATKAMKDAGYRTSELAMRPLDRDRRLDFWSIDEGVLIVSYSVKSKKIVGISYWFSDERPKATRKTFDLRVKTFDTDTGEMVIQTK